ncbi:MAG: dTDP-4-amino-4,6-dideoxygalactose transaminase [Deltaproteobacteria bacterium]|nr:dTDP-4-amino-4,6-dideoxygalactose transaminase [Deltaproteobacteria bacterium]
MHELEFDAREAAAAQAAILGGAWQGHGRVGRRVEEKLSAALGGGDALLTTSCTHAIEMAVALAGVEPGDEVIVPSYAFVSCANAVVQLGGVPVFADSEAKTLGLDAASVEAKITGRTKAVLVIDYAGLAADHRALRALCAKYDLFYIEDAAHGIGARQDGKALGTFGDAACFSFHATKNIACGEGGALWVGRGDRLALAEQMREKGTDRARFLHGLVDKYTWRTRGSSYVLSDILAAVLEVQLSRLDAVTKQRRALFEAYLARLQPKAAKLGLRLPVVPAGAEPNGHLMWAMLDGKRRDPALKALRAAGVDAAFHYLALHRSPYAQEHGFDRGALPMAEQAAATLLRLPLHSRLSVDDIKTICERFEDVLARI